jgi:hypothetical protein
MHKLKCKIPRFLSRWMRRRRLPFLCVVFVSCFLPCRTEADGPKNISFDESYDPFYQEQFHALMALAKEVVPRAYQEITRQWGLPEDYGLRHPLLVQVKSIPSDTLRSWKAAYVQPVGRGDQFHQFLVIDIECYLQNPHEDLQMVIRHEMAHVIVMDLETGPKSLPIPAWFNEGLAQSVTAEGRKRVQAEIVEASRSGEPPILCDLDGSVDEFAHGPFNAKCYAQYYLTVQHLRQIGGPQTVPKFLIALLEGRSVNDLMPWIAGVKWPAFEEDSEQYVEDVFSGSKPVP